MHNEMTFSDLGRVKWGATLKISLGRAFFSGTVIACAVLATAPGTASASGAGELAGTALAIPFVWGLVGPFVSTGMWGIGRVLGFISDLLPDFAGLFVGLAAAMMTLAASFYMCLGDPIVYMLNRSFPRLFNVADFGFFNFRPMIFVTEPD